MTTPPLSPHSEDSEPRRRAKPLKDKELRAMRDCARLLGALERPPLMATRDKRQRFAESRDPEPGSGDGTDRLCWVLYGRGAKPADWLGGSQARMLHDAAALLERMRDEGKL